MNQRDRPQTTNPSLLGRLRADPRDQQSWNEFVGRYGPMVLTWARRWGLNQQDAEDMTQNVLLQLARQMKNFRYDPQASFRAWLKTIAHRAWCDTLSDLNRRNKNRLGSDVMAQFMTDDRTASFLEMIDQLARNEQMEHAMNRVRLRVQPRTWQAFEMTAIDNLPVEQVANALQMNIPSVYVAKSRVIRLIRLIVEQD